MFDLFKPMGVGGLCLAAILASRVPALHGQGMMHMQRGMAIQPPFFNTSMAAPPIAFDPFANPGLANFYGRMFPGLGTPYGTLSPYAPAYLYSYGLYGGLPYVGSFTNGYGSSNSTGSYDSSASTKPPTRRRAAPDKLSARELAQDAEEERQRRERERLEQNRDHPSLTEIWSGSALNFLLVDLRKLAGHGAIARVEEAATRLNPGLLPHINVTRGAGNVALLKNDGRLQWPAALQETDDQAERERLSGASVEAVRQARTTKALNSDLLRQFATDLDRLDESLRARAATLSPSAYIEAKSFLHNLQEAVRALRQPDAARHFDGTYDVQAQTIAELVQQMSARGLQFAPALAADRDAYALIHDALANYDRAAHWQIETR